MKIIFQATQTITYEFAATGKTLADISAKVRQAKAEEAAADTMDLRDLMYSGEITSDVISGVKIVRREEE